MPRNFITGDDTDQGMLLPLDVREWLPEGDLAWFVDEVVAELDLGKFLNRYRGNGQGRAAFHPALMLRVLLYAHLQGIRSSRAIERACQRDVGFRVLARNQSPDHATVARFVVRHRTDLEELFTQALRLCAAAGLLRLDTIAVDGTKIAASASWSANKTEPALAHLLTEQEALLAEQTALLSEAQAAALAAGTLGEQVRRDAAEDAEHGPDRGDELPPALRRAGERRDRIRAAKQRLEDERQAAQAAQDAKREAHRRRQQQDPSQGPRGGRAPGEQPPAPRTGQPPRANTTDPAAKAMRGGRGLVLGFHAQAAVTEDQVIVGAVVSQKPTDITLLPEVLDEVDTQLRAAGLDPGQIATVLADAGYASEDCFLDVEGRDRQLLAPLAKDKARALGEDPAAGQNLARRPATARAQALLRTPEGAAAYRQRGTTVEPVFGQIKDRLGLRMFARRGLANVTSEWLFTATVHNLRKLFLHRALAPA